MEGKRWNSRKRRPEMVRHQRWQTRAGGGADEARGLGPRVAEESFLHEILQQRHARCFVGARRPQAGSGARVLVGARSEGSEQCWRSDVFSRTVGLGYLG
jgi:hypothetical protein